MMKAKEEQALSRQDAAKELQQVQRQLNAVQSNFNMTADADQIEACIYQMIELEKQHHTLLQQLREKEA